MNLRKGLTLTEVLVVIVIIGILLGLLLPAVHHSHVSYRMSCSNNFKMLGLAIHNYHSAFKRLPPTMFGGKENQGRLSGLVPLLPFVEHQELWETISHPNRFDGRRYPAFGPHPQDADYDPWRTEVPLFRCPSDRSESTRLGKTNFAFCVGDQANRLYDATSNETVRGFGSPSKVMRFHDITDGLSNTLMMAEIGTHEDRRLIGNFSYLSSEVLEVPARCLEIADPNQPSRYNDAQRLGVTGRGGAWADGSGGFGLVNTILPPNSPSCVTSPRVPLEGILSAGSTHLGGCHVLLGDGAVIYITDSIDTGDANAPTVHAVTDENDRPIPSSFGIWGALGTRAGEEQIDAI